jgi:hypothetical protein
LPSGIYTPRSRHAHPRDVTEITRGAAVIPDREELYPEGGARERDPSLLSTELYGYPKDEVMKMTVSGSPSERGMAVSPFSPKASAFRVGIKRWGCFIALTNCERYVQP